MKRIVFPFFLFFMLFSCKDNKEVQQEKTTDIADTSVVEKVTPVDEAVSEDADFKNDFDILLATSYRTWENKNPATSLTKNWRTYTKRMVSSILEKPILNWKTAMTNVPEILQKLSIPTQKHFFL